MGVNASRRFPTEDTASRWFPTSNSPVVGPRTKFTTVQRFQCVTDVTGAGVPVLGCRTSVGKSVNSGRSPGLSFTHLSASMAVVGVRPELTQATEARSAARTCARWLAGRLPSASSIGLELDSTKSTCSPSVSSSRRLLPMVIRPGIGLVKLRRGVDTASRRDTGHAAAPPAGPAVHPVGLSQLRRWPIRPSGAP